MAKLLYLQLFQVALTELLHAISTNRLVKESKLGLELTRFMPAAISNFLSALKLLNFRINFGVIHDLMKVNYIFK